MATQIAIWQGSLYCTVISYHLTVQLHPRPFNGCLVQLIG